MFASFSDPFETLLTLQRALDSRIASDWMGRGTATIGSFPPINVFQKDDDFVAVVELPGIDKNDLWLTALRREGEHVSALGLSAGGATTCAFADCAVKSEGHRQIRNPLGERCFSNMALCHP
jgi:hypothetical protein